MEEYEETYGLKTKQIYVRDLGLQCKISIRHLSSIFRYYLAIQLPLLCFKLTVKSNKHELFNL